MRTQPAASTAPFLAPPVSLAPRNIAIIDDDELFLSTFATNLSANGYRVSTFRNPRMALKVLMNMTTLEALIIDWRMPDIDGASVIDTLKAW